MGRSLMTAAAVGGLGAAALAAHAQTWELIPFTYLPPLGGVQASRVEGMARDGSVIVGEVCRVGFRECGARRPVHWLPTLEMFTLPVATGGADEFALSVSDDAGVITVGTTSGVAATRWIGGPHGTVERFIEVEEGGGVARDVSADGLVVVGDTTRYNEEFFGSNRGFVKVGDAAVELLEPLPGYVHARVYAVTADGMTILGTSYAEADASGFLPSNACTWSLQTLQPTSLPQFTGAPGAATDGYDISSDGRVVVGAAIFRDQELGFVRYRAVRWVRTGEEWGDPQDLAPDDDCYACIASRVSADGSVILGQRDRGGVFLWREGRPAANLATLLTDAGVDLDGWSPADVAGITDDGGTIVGNAGKRVCPCKFCDCYEFIAGYRVVLADGACAADFDGSGRVDSADFFAFLVALFEGSTSADFDDNGVVNSQDFFEYLGAFLAGC